MNFYLYGFQIFIISAYFYSSCSAGLLDLLLGNNVVPQQRIYSLNNNNQISRALQNLAATRERYNVRNNNWAQPTSISTEDNGNTYNEDNDDNSQEGQAPSEDLIQNERNSPTNVAQNTNMQNVVTSQVSGIPFTNSNPGEGFNNNPLVNQFPNTNGVSYNRNVNTPITNRSPGTVANLPKIIQDMKKINSIVDQIKQQNANNQGNRPNSAYPNYNIHATNNYPPVRINNGLSQGVLTNNNNQSPFNQPDHTKYTRLPKVPQYNVPISKDPDLNTAVTNPPVLTPPPGNLMTNAPPSTENVNSQTNPKNNTRESSNDNSSESLQTKHNHTDRYVLRPITKRRFFVQVEPVVPAYKIVKHNETIYYVD